MIIIIIIKKRSLRLLTLKNFFLETIFTNNFFIIVYFININADKYPLKKSLKTFQSHSHISIFVYMLDFEPIY
jgi:hypothetical protein